MKDSPLQLRFMPTNTLLKSQSTLWRLLASLQKTIERAIRRPVNLLFLRSYYADEIHTWRDTWFLGHQVFKCPTDLWVYQEILSKLRPDLIIETGTAYGGSALYLASICDLINHGHVVTIDVKEIPTWPIHNRITYLVGSSVEEKIVAKVSDFAKGASTVLVILDSDHSLSHVAAELKTYAPFVTQGSYLIVEDTIVNGHPVYWGHGPGPMEAAMKFLKENGDFEMDRSLEKFRLTFNPKGFLRRVAS
jgi:cephalosporin hydroxylase